MDALIGHSGFVGGTLMKQTRFGSLYRSTNIHEIDGLEFDTVVCAGVPATKWLANKEPDVDRRGIDRLIAHLQTVKCRRFILISTVDVFKYPVDVDEDSPIDEANLHPYGLHRRHLELFVARTFRSHLIVRLPGVVGPGLRKNIVYDLLNDNNLTAVDHRSVFQFYPMINLWPDLETAWAAGLNLVHLTAEPISVADVASLAFGRTFNNEVANPPAVYNMCSRHGLSFGSPGPYLYGRREIVLALRAYAQSEPRQKAP